MLRIGIALCEDENVISTQGKGIQDNGKTGDEVGSRLMDSDKHRVRVTKVLTYWRQHVIQDKRPDCDGMVLG